MIGVIFAFNVNLLKLVDHFINLGSRISSTESDINILMRILWTAIERLLVIRESDLFDEIKPDFFSMDKQPGLERNE